MYNFFKNISGKNPCSSIGVCSIDPVLNALEAVLLNEIREIAYYMVKLNDFGYRNDEIMKSAVKGLSVIIINTAFRHEDYMKLLFELAGQNKEVENKYKKMCREKRIPCEIIQDGHNIFEESSFTELIKIGENIIQNRSKMFSGDKLRLVELISIFSKTTSINLQKLLSYDVFIPDWYFEVLRFFSLTSTPATRVEKLKRRITEFSNTAFDIQQKYIETLEEKFGKRKEALIKTDIKKGLSIMVSGPDLNELKALLDAIGDREINVYTNSSMFLAHCYPEFAKYTNLKGQYGGDDTEYEFTNFKGLIYVTQYFLQKVDTLRRGVIFTTKIIAPEKMIRITGGDYEPLISFALNSQGFDECTKGKNILLKYDFDEIDKITKNQGDEPLAIIVGAYINEKIIDDFKGRKILKLDSPIETDLLFYALKNCTANNTEIIFTQCNTLTINMMLSLLGKGLKDIYFAKCPNSLINPHVIDALSEDFRVKLI